MYITWTTFTNDCKTNRDEVMRDTIITFDRSDDESLFIDCDDHMDMFTDSRSHKVFDLISNLFKQGHLLYMCKVHHTKYGIVCIKI